MASSVHRIFTRSWGLPVFVINGEGDAWHLAATRWKVSRARAPVGTVPMLRTALIVPLVTLLSPPVLAEGRIRGS